MNRNSNLCQFEFSKVKNAEWYLVTYVLLALNGIPRNLPNPPGGGGVLPYMGYIGMCRCEGYGFQAVYSRIGYTK